ncbi:MAG: guanosine-3',5'-bis(diphosphate) 3'-pyrophosphohydrolase [Pasteurellales bacterium]|nr:MAG: guanosine-3',5'-bis(diphosphate) 3'-pyrophosphohydrolase [Pasteurellales bacterium]
MYLGEIFKPLDDVCKTYLTSIQCEKITKAFIFARDAHEGQYRSSGEPYISHPVVVAKILAEMHLDDESIISALLHDVIEDTPVTEEEVAQHFGSEVALIVQGVSKLDKLKFRTRQEAQVANFQKMLLAMTQDVRVILIKLADRTHNMQTLGSLRPDKRKRIAKETLEIYTPIAHRLGLEKLRKELEDLCLSAIYPKRSEIIAKAKNHAKHHHQKLLNTIIEEIQTALKQVGIKAQVFGQEKHNFSIYLRMRIHNQKFKSILDVYNFKIIVESIDNCYRALGVIHQLYSPRPQMFKDYIAIPKLNGYQSLHTSLLGHKGMPIDVHIRTSEMHQQSTLGIVAFWSSEQKDETKKAKTITQRSVKDWLKEIDELKTESQNDNEFVDHIKSALFKETIFVFTPRGRIIELAKGSCPIDFAYALHSDLGNYCQSVLIDGKIEPLNYKLQSGQTVEIQRSRDVCVQKQWLNFVVMPKSKVQINNILRKS